MKKGTVAVVFVCLLAAGAAVFAFRYLKPGLTAEPELAAETTVQTTEATTAATEPPKPFGYVHGEEGYFSLADLGEAPAVRVQEGGTDWINAAACAMESEHLRTTGKKISVDPYMLMDSVYRRFKLEGYCLKDDVSSIDAGGSGRAIVQSLSNGYNGWLLTDSNEFDGVPREEMQEAIRRQGALMVSVPDRDEAKKTAGDYKTMHDPDAAAEDCNHSLILIGWDDHFPKDYFRTPAENDGAWLAQDTRSYQDPYFWISYDTPLKDCLNFTVSGMHGTVQSYDYGQMKTVCTGAETSVANVFHHGGKLTSVCTYTAAHGQSLTVEIRAGEFGSLLYAQKATFPYKGYHTVKLDTPQQVTDCTVIVRFAGEAPVEGGKWEDENYEYRVKSEEGQSFIEAGGDWLDLSETGTKEALGLDFAPNNACIKAIFQ